MYWGCCSYVPIIDEVADILGLSRGTYWTDAAALEIFDLIYGMQLSLERGLHEYEKMRLYFPDMLTFSSARQIAKRINIQEMTFGVILTGITPATAHDWEANVPTKNDTTGLTLVRTIVPGAAGFNLYTGTKSTRPLDDYVNPDLADLR